MIGGVSNFIFACICNNKILRRLSWNKIVKVFAMPLKVHPKQKKLSLNNNDKSNNYFVDVPLRHMTWSDLHLHQLKHKNEIILKAIIIVQTRIEMILRSTCTNQTKMSSSEYGINRIMQTSILRFWEKKIEINCERKSSTIKGHNKVIVLSSFYIRFSISKFFFQLRKHCELVILLKI